jgi:hypothetical protein
VSASAEIGAGSCSEYYYVAHSLQFMRSQALVREHIVAELNNLVRRLGVSSAIRVEGLPTAALIAENIVKLEKGEVSFTTVLQASRGY